MKILFLHLKVFASPAKLCCNNIYANLKGESNMEKSLNLEEMVKFFELEKAHMNNLPLTDCIGEISRPVTYGSTTITVDTEITEKDIQDYNYCKNPVVYCFADCLPE